MSRIREESRHLPDYMIAVILLSPAFIVASEKCLGIAAKFSSLVIFCILAFLLFGHLFSRQKITITVPHAIVCLVLTLTFILSKLIFRDTPYSLAQFGFYVLLPLLVSAQKISAVRILRILLLSSIPLLFVVEKILELENVGLNQADMYATYSLLPTIMAGFLHFFFLRSNKDGIKNRPIKSLILLVAYISTAYLCIRTAKTAVRGYWLAIIAFFATIAALKAQLAFKKKGVYCAVLVAIWATAILVALNIGQIVGGIVKLTNPHLSEETPIVETKGEEKQTYNTENDSKSAAAATSNHGDDGDRTDLEAQPRAEAAAPNYSSEDRENAAADHGQDVGIGILAKTEHLSAKGDIFNGRLDIWKNTLRFIASSPILGNGIGSTGRLSNGDYPYPHNFALQLLQDCGIIALALIAVVCFGIIHLFGHGHDDSKLVLSFLFSISIPVAMLSGDVWKNSSIWLFMGYSLLILIGKHYGKNKK